MEYPIQRTSVLFDYLLGRKEKLVKKKDRDSDGHDDADHNPRRNANSNTDLRCNGF